MPKVKQKSQYKKHIASRYEFPSRVVVNATSGVLVIGHKQARKHIETTLKRALHEDTFWRKRGGNWVFFEPR